jgi:uncharacterized membrane protein/thiol-disulfide isomerase/thioredoxin
MRTNLNVALTILLLATLLTASPAQAQTSNELPVARAVLFWMETCGHCHYVIENVLQPLQSQHQEQLEILLIEVRSIEDFDRLIQVAAVYGIPKEEVGVPFLLIGDRVLVGSAQIPAELPGLVESYLADGGVDYPDLPVLADLLPATAPIEEDDPIAPPVSEENPSLPVVHLLLFWTSDCHACRTVMDQALPPLKEKYGEQLTVDYVDVVTGEDVDRFYQVAAAFGIPPEQADLPMLIVGDQVLFGAERIPAELPGLVEMYLAEGGVELPDITRLVEAAASPDATLPARPDGFNLAIGVMVFMVVALLYALAAALSGKSLLSFLRPGWADPLFTILALAGLGVALYLAYVETQAVSAVCGPVGDCNAVQSSPYARLFGVLPIGVLGLIGYLAIFAGWFYPRLRADRIAQFAPLVVFGMALFGVIFSIYLTYLEPFVIRAVCMWCLSSAVIMTLLLLLSLRPALQALGASQEEG